MENVINLTREMIFACLESLVPLTVQPQDFTEKKRILIVRVDAIGDFILWLDAAKAFRKLYPPDKYKITLMGNSAWTSLAERLSCFDEVWSLDRRVFFKNPFYRLSVLRRIRSAQFDIVISPAFSREFHFGDAVVRASGAPERIGSAGDTANTTSWQKRLSDRWYTRLVPASTEPMMELVRNAEFIRDLGFSGFHAAIPEMPVPAVLPAGFGSAGEYYVLVPGAGAPIRQWPTRNFAELAQMIYRQTGLTGIVCGAPAEKLLGAEILRFTGVPLENWAGRTSLPELAAIIAGAHFLVGNDTGAIHMAAVVSTPSVAILGGGHFGRFHPYRIEVPSNRPVPVPVFLEKKCFYCNWECKETTDTRETAPCIAAVSVDRVWEAVQNLLQVYGVSRCPSKTKECS